MDRAELAGTGAALAFHVALVAALSLHLAQVDTPPEPPSMEVELVDDIGLTAAAPQALAPPPSEAPEIGEAEPIEPTPAPAIAPPPATPAIVPTPAPRPEPAAKPAPAKRVPPKAAPTKPAPAKAPPAKAPARAAPRASRIGDDFLKGIADDAPASRAPAKAAAATFNAAAKADVASAIAAQIRPCALRQRALGEGANRIRVVLNIRLTLAGRLKGAPTVVRTSGVDEENSQYEELVKDQAIASYRECAPLRLPAELYQTAQGGWSNINMNYKVP
jgi:outer membrane biosynthesis protein TonB